MDARKRERSEADSHNSNGGFKRSKQGVYSGKCCLFLNHLGIFLCFLRFFGSLERLLQNPLSAQVLIFLNCSSELVINSGANDNINEASRMVRELIERLGLTAAAKRPLGVGGFEGKPYPGSNFKTKLCDKFAKGSCTYGDRCNFAHGEAELRRSGIA